MNGDERRKRNQGSYRVHRRLEFEFFTAPEGAVFAKAAMTHLEELWKGLLAGVAIAAPVGPVNVLCLRRTLAKGWKSGLVSGFGAAAADAFYGGIAAFSVRLVIQFLRSEEARIKLIGGLLLIG